MQLFLTWLLPMALFLLWFAWHEGVGFRPEPREVRITGAVFESAIKPGPVDVRDFGAVGDYVTNDSMAFQLAFDAAAASGEPIFVPPGKYLVGDLVVHGPLFPMNADALRAIARARR